MATKTTASKPAATKKTAKKTPAKIGGKKTVIIAKVDVGYGNSVYLRGKGGGLSWDVGVLMDCVKKDEWIWSCPSGDGPILFKFARNDLHWETGKDRKAPAGEITIVIPQFPPW
jgi:hypothetical protein